MELFLFVVLGLVAIGSSLAMIGHKSPIYSALYMVMTFATTAVMYVLLQAPFVAAIQIIIYAGAVVVLFLFVIMFLNLKDAVLLERRRGPLLLAFVIAGLVAGELAAVVATGAWPETAAALQEHCVLQVQEHDDEQEQDDDRPGVDDHLEDADELRVEPDEEHGEQEEVRYECARAVHGVLVEDDAERARHRERRDHEEGDRAHATCSPQSRMASAVSTTFTSASGRSPFHPSFMSWS